MRVYLMVLLIAAAVTYLLSGLARRLAFRFNAVATVRDRDVHTKPIPYFGGISMWVGLVAAFMVATSLPWLGEFAQVRHDAVAVVIAGGVICAVGVLDDMFELNALAKVAGQLMAAGLLVLNGVKVYWIPLPDRIIALDDGTSIVVTMVLIFVAVNAINLIDGLDGLAAGVVAIGASAFFSYAYLLSYEQELVRATGASLITVATVGISWASCLTTCIRLGCSWGTPARCCWASYWRRRRSASPGRSIPPSLPILAPTRWRPTCRCWCRWPRWPCHSLTW